jgi:hypothetical protein
LHGKSNGKSGKGNGDKGKHSGKHVKGDKNGKTKSNGKFDKGKHKSKSSQTPYFDGACNYCQKWGHKASDCRSNPKNGSSGKGSIHHVAEQEGDTAASPKQQTQQDGNKNEKTIGSGKGTVSAMYAEEFPEESNSVTSLELVHEVSAMSSCNNDSALMFIDSGSAIMACPPSLATKYSAIEKKGRQLSLKGVNGSKVSYYGTAVLRGSLETYQGNDFTELPVHLHMEVADVSQIIASISSLAKRGFSC